MPGKVVMARERCQADDDDLTLAVNFKIILQLFFHSATLARAAYAWIYIFSWKNYFLFKFSITWEHESRSAVVVDVCLSDPMKERLPCFCLWKIFLVARWRGSRRRWKTTKIHEWKSFESFSRDIIARLLISRAFQRHRRSSFMWVSRSAPMKIEKRGVSSQITKARSKTWIELYNSRFSGYLNVELIFFAWISRIQLKAADIADFCGKRIIVRGMKLA